MRSDGRTNTDPLPYAEVLGTVPEAYGSATATFGEQHTQVICAIKAEIQKPLASTPLSGQVTFHLESSQTGSTLFKHEADAESLRQKMIQILQTLLGNTIINRDELTVFKGEFAWNLNVDLLVLDELCLSQVDAIARAVRAAFSNLALPQVIATLNANTNKIEVGLVEEVYTDRANTDALVKLKSACDAPYIVSVAIVRDAQADMVVLDCDSVEIQCVD
jgi:exosome complex RNA-binding protein Rrp42 (RNase PH superfamily)